MPKKSRPLPRQTTRKKTRKKVRAPAHPPAAVSIPKAEETVTPPPPSPAARQETFSDKVVIADLKKTGIIAGAIFAILIALSLVLR
jgi:hypothetical protein